MSDVALMTTGVQAARPDVENARGTNVDVSLLGTTSWLSADRSRDRPKTVKVSTQSLVRYASVRPCKHLYMSKHSLDVTRCG